MLRTDRSTPVPKFELSLLTKFFQPCIDRYRHVRRDTSNSFSGDGLLTQEHMRGGRTKLLLFYA